jgi:RNA-directed DNA polymerase
VEKPGGSTAGLLFARMNLEGRLVEAISDEARKLILRHHAYHNALELEHQRKQKRKLGVAQKSVKVPGVWTQDRKFDPFYVYSRRRNIARSVARKMASGTYIPSPPEKKQIPKSSGGFRTVTMYQIPDQAVSRLIYEQLLRKNRHRLSSFAYAYRDDRNVQFAIQDIAVELKQNARVFIAEFDFSKFFDSINHEYLFAQFSQNGFLISPEEQRIIGAFLEGMGGTSATGIPQGTSISLFLANLVCWRLDKGLEKAGLQFARYADDTVIWSQDYQKISRAYELIAQFSKETGVPINTDKSDGISLLCRPDMPSEFASRKEHFDFLGYAISVESVRIKAKSVNKIKKEISYTLYKHLIQPLIGAKLVGLVIPSGGQDPALLSAMNEIRRFLYGNLTDDMIRNYLTGSSSHIFFKGVMSAYPLIDDEEQMRSLDGWLVTAIYKSLRKRAALLKKWGYDRSGMFPFNVRRRDVPITFRMLGGKKLRIPSFFAMYRTLKKGIAHIGMGAVLHASADVYGD